MTPEAHQSYKLSREKYDFWFELKTSIMQTEIASKAILRVEIKILCNEHICAEEYRY
jgi:hypothetical protein